MIVGPRIGYDYHGYCGFHSIDIPRYRHTPTVLKEKRGTLAEKILGSNPLEMRRRLVRDVSFRFGQGI